MQLAVTGMFDGELVKASVVSGSALFGFVVGVALAVAIVWLWKTRR